MDGLIALFIVFGLIKALSKAAQKQAEKNKQAKPKVPPSAFGQTVKKQPAMTAAERVVVPAFAVAEEGQSHMGSLMTENTEGMDLCDPSLEHDRENMLDLQSVYTNEIGEEHRIDLSPNGLWQGVVMSEILTRPADRHRRKGASWRN